jgi:hypothetical protein
VFHDYASAAPLTIGQYFVKAANDRSFGFRDEQVITDRFGIRLIHTPAPATAAWQLTGTLDDTGRIAQGGPVAHFVAFSQTTDQTEIPVRLTLGTFPPEGKGVQRYEVDGRRGAIRAGKTRDVTGVARLDRETGYISMPLRALGKTDATRGIQVLNVYLG